MNLAKTFSILISLSLVGSICLIAGGCKSSGYGIDLGVKIEIKKRSLPNGIKILMVEDHTVPVVSYQSWYRVGSVDENSGETGIAHLFEHLMFKGTQKYGPKQFFHLLEGKGASVNAFTTRDYTVYYEVIAPDLLEQVIDMESDRLAHLKLDEASLKTEVQVVLEERRLRTENSPHGKIQEALWQLAFNQHPYRWPVIGFPQDLLKLDVKKIETFFEKHYQPSNLLIVAVGDIEADETFNLIAKYYGGISSHKQPERNFPKELDQNEEHRLVLYDHVSSEIFGYAYPITSAHDEDSYALDVLANILFEGSNSRAHRSLVEDKDVALSVSGTAFTPTYPGLFLISGSMKGHHETETAEKLLNDIIKEVQENEVSKEEIDIAVKQLSVQFIDSILTPHGLAQLLGTVQTVFGDPDRFTRDLGKYLKVTASDVKRVAQKYLHPNNRSIVRMVPTGKKKQP